MTQGLFNDGTSSFMTMLEDAPYQVNVEFHQFEPDRELDLFKVKAINTRNHLQVKNVRFGLIHDAIKFHFRHGYDKNTRD